MSPRKSVATSAKRAWGGSATSPGRRSATRRSAVDQRAIEAALSNPEQAQPETVLQLQRLGGNGAVRGLLASRRAAALTPSGVPFIQRHKAEPKPGEEQQDADDDDDAVQRSVDGARGQAPAVQRANIKKGKALPDLNVETGKKLNKALGWDPRIQTLAGARMLKKLLIVVQTNASVRAAMGPAGATATDDVVRDVREAYVGPLRDALAKLRKIALESRGGLKTSDATGLVFDIENEVDTALRAKFKGTDLQARKAVTRAIGSAYGDRGGAAREVFDAARGGMRMEPAYLPAAARGQFAAALKLLPVMKTLTEPGGAKAAVLGGAQGAQGAAQGAQGNKPSEWADGGKLSDTIVVKPSKGIPGWLSKRRAASKMQKFKTKVDAVDAWVRMMVEPELLRRVPRPEMVMHTRGRMRALGNTQRFAFLPDPSGYRPNYTDPERKEPGRVHLPYDEMHSLIAHEVGHAIEGFLPIQSWHDMNLLLERRHEEKVGSSRAARTGATMWTSGLVTNEGRYAGTYETGKYTSTAYDDGGNSEVFSQAMEFFSNPANALKLIDGDPQHAAIVLRAIRPNEYRSIDALREFDKYLPRKGGGGAG
jgi:hypothetical protein